MRVWAALEIRVVDTRSGKQQIVSAIAPTMVKWAIELDDPVMGIGITEWGSDELREQERQRERSRLRESILAARDEEERHERFNRRLHIGMVVGWIFLVTANRLPDLFTLLFH